MSSYQFSKICKELISITDIVDIEVDTNYIKFSVDGKSIIGGITLENNNSDDLDLQCEIKTNTKINLSFSLRYLNMFTKASTVGKQVNLFLSEKFPLLVEYKIGELGFLKFYLSPRIPDNEEN